MCVLLPVNAGMQTKCHCGVTIAKKGRNYHNECSDCEKTRLSKYQRPSSAPSSSSSSSLSFSSIPTPSFSLLARPASASTHTPLTVDRRLGIVGAVEAEAPMDIIQQKSSVTRSTIDKLVDRYHKTGTVDDLPRSGRPPLFNDEEKKKIVDMSMEIGEDGYKKYSTVKAIKNDLEIDCHPCTYARVLSKENIHGRVRRCAHPITEANRLERLSFARSVANWTNVDWSKVLFSDETIIPSVYSNNEQWCLRRPNEQWLPENTKPDKNRFSPIQLNAWGCIAASGVGTLYLTTDTFDGPFYLKILKDCLFESKNNLHLPDDWKFVQDNARPHIEASVERWIYKNNVTMLHLPANSPDLNPIELIWSHLKPIINNKFPKSLEELEDAAIEVWNSFSHDFIRNSIYDMSRRIREVIKNNGNRIG